MARVRREKYFFKHKDYFSFTTFLFYSLERKSRLGEGVLEWQRQGRAGFFFGGGLEWDG